MASDFLVTVASVTENLFDGPAASLTVPGTEGEMTLLPHHEPFVTTLKAGTVTVKAGGETREFSIGGGVLECSGDRAVVLL
jgi:F-type H+-transporting ATPase subunit epsilon